MSSLAYDTPESQILMHNYLHLVGITILYYDHLLTCGEEYLRIWRASRSGASILFLINRYLAFFANITVTAGNFGRFRSVESCKHYAFYRQLVLIATALFVSVIQFLRTYALYGRNKRVAALMLGVGASLTLLSIWAIIGQHSTVSLLHGCHIASSRMSSVHIATDWESLFVFDLMIFVLTLLRTYNERLVYSFDGKLDIVSLIVRDGAIYFGVMAIAQGANVVTFYVCAPALRGVFSTAASAISVTMMSRLMLNLHRTAACHSDVLDATEHTGTSTLQFSTGITAGTSMLQVGDGSFEGQDCAPNPSINARLPDVGRLPNLQTVFEVAGIAGLGARSASHADGANLV